ncbi:MAG: 3'-5' exonuclease [Polyangiaceae bacterium]|jgi:DNA polymerase-3 subunit epsilon|nr:3'-5' exonuclease [Polyangiaceae bacterium]
MRPSADGCGCFPTGQHYPGIAHLLRVRIAGIADELDEASPWSELPIVMIDTETTGREPADDRIVEVAVVRGRGGVVESRHAWLINPGRPIPAEATAVHGIKDDDVRDKPSFAEVCDEILAALAAAIPAAYNATFDRNFVLAEVKRAGRSTSSSAPAVRDRVVWLDPLIWARHVFAAVRSRKLGDVAELLGVKLEQAHRATADAEAALLVMFKLGQDDRVPKTYGKLIQEQLRLSRAQEEARKMWRNR